MAGYHFTTLELGRLNTLGLGVGWTLTGKAHPKYDSGPVKHDFAVTTSQSIRLTDENDLIRGNIYFNIVYGYNLVKQTHGLYFGVSIGER